MNYSSIPAGLIEFRRRMEALQWQLLVPGPAGVAGLRAGGTGGGQLSDCEIGADGTAPRFDPMKDIQADILAVRAGVMTLKEAIARQSYEPAQDCEVLFGHRLHGRRPTQPLRLDSERDVPESSNHRDAPLPTKRDPAASGGDGTGIPTVHYVKGGNGSRGINKCDI